MELKKGYKQTEVGAIPNDWNICKLGDIAYITKLAGYEYSKYFNSYKDGGEIIVIRGTNITHNRMDLADVKTIPKKISDFLHRSKLNKNDLVFAYVGTIGPIYLVEENDRYHLGPNTAKISVNADLNVSFINTYFKSNLIRKEIIDHTSIGAQPSLSMSKIRKFNIILPTSKIEQAAIASALSDADALISSLEKLIAKKRLIKQGAMQHLLKPKKGWEVKKLGEVGTIITGSTPPTQITKYWNGSIPWITPTDISNIDKNIVHSEREISNEGLSVIRKLPENTLLVTCIASIGKNAILRNKGACNQQINAIIPFHEYDVDFLYYLIEKNKQYLLGKAGITATLMISKKDFSEILFSFPSKEEQTHIATILSDMDAELSALEQKLEKYKKIKLGMMQELLTGKVRLI